MKFPSLSSFSSPSPMDHAQCLRLMVFNSLRAGRYIHRFWGTSTLSLDSFCAFGYPVICSRMKEIKVKDASTWCTLVPDGEPHIQSVCEDHKCSSVSVKSTPEIEKKYVHRVYDAIAPHFSSTRFAKWPKVAAFLESLPTGSLVLDAGCGNGKYLGLNSSCYFIGCDISPPLIKICVDKGHEALVADAVNLPYRTNFGDAAISIAVLHHLSTENRRKKAIEELVRVVRKGGLVLITVWAVEQEDKSLLTKWTPLTEKHVEEWRGPRSPCVRCPSSFSLESIPETEENGLSGHMKDSRESLMEDMQQSACLNPQNKDDSLVSKDGRSQQEYFVPWHLPYHRAEVSGASAVALATGLAKKDDKKGAVVYNRYYHVFGEGELESGSLCTLFMVEFGFSNMKNEIKKLLVKDTSPSLK
ncbi:alkylated DNA repair protein alkB homolog 8-like isoform X2 [Durio zibethinus]|uniref:Alkylated DNA repair protein alkB homolog 8-like isoform X2 n=1 Tax=Durio zibethinus TaxID=66656 RepID=A0A6P5YVI1_DURZI|nr:alkylated DNA repair protein alkB homolog 8-like isoform X2 [Durio zibethinus]